MITTPINTSGLDRARPDAVHAAHRPVTSMTTWRGVTGSANPCGTTGLASVTGVYTANLPAGVFEQTIKRPTRPLGTRST